MIDIGDLQELEKIYGQDSQKIKEQKPENIPPPQGRISHHHRAKKTCIGRRLMRKIYG
jgi:hypothetical protein